MTTTLTLRGYQVDALAKVAAAEAAGIRRQLGVAATGLGKTVLFCALARQRGGRALILAHRDELVGQAVAKVREVWPGADVGVVKGSENDVRAQVVVASVQTLSRTRRLAQLLAPFDPDGLSLMGRAAPIELVVVDEAHHSASDSYRKILAALNAGAPNGPLLLGVTATPDRGDGKGLDDLFDDITFNYDILWGIRAGYLSDLRGKRITIDDLDMGAIKVKAGDYDQGQAGAAMTDAGAPQVILRAWLEHAAGRRTLVFTPTVALAAEVAAEFVGAGIRAAMVSGATPLDERRRTLAAFHAGDIDVLANCAVLTEGYDEPAVSCIVIARPTKSRALFTQMVGRGTRRHPDKTDCLILDVVGNSDVHSLITIPSLFGLDPDTYDRPDAPLIARQLEEREQEQIRIGLLRAEDVDLFTTVRREGIAWVPVHAEDDTLRRYIRALGRNADGTYQPTVILAQRGPETWTAGLHHADGRKEVLVADTTLELAQGVAEDHIRAQATNTTLVNADAPWRARPPSPKAVAAAKKWRMKVDPAWTAGQLSEALDAHIARRTGAHT